MSDVYFVIGVNGIGKSSVIPYLKENLVKGSFEIYDFDERGVPNNADKIWRQSETLYWTGLGKSNLEKDITTIICGFSKLIDINEAGNQLGFYPKVILLDASDEVISKRILSRYQTEESLVELERTTSKTPEEFIKGNLWTATQFRKEKYFATIDTSLLTPEQVAKEVTSKIDIPLK